MPIGQIQAVNVNPESVAPTVHALRPMFETANKESAEADKKRETVYQQMLKDPKNAQAYSQATGVPISQQMQALLAEPEKAQRIGEAVSTAKNLGIDNYEAKKIFTEAYVKNGGNVIEAAKAVGDLDVRADAKMKFIPRPDGTIVGVDPRSMTGREIPVGGGAPAQPPAAPSGDYGALLTQGMDASPPPGEMPPEPTSLPAQIPDTPMRAPTFEPAAGGGLTPRQQQAAASRPQQPLTPPPGLSPAGRVAWEKEHIKADINRNSAKGQLEETKLQDAQILQEQKKQKAMRAAKMFVTQTKQKLAVLEEINPANPNGPDGIEGTDDDTPSKVDWSTAGWVGSKLKGLEGSDAFDLEARLLPILADEAFSALQEMRDNSPTGGALGQVTERELAMLQSKRANLDTAQSPEQLRVAINELKTFITESQQRVEEAYQADFGVPMDGGGDAATPAAADAAPPAEIQPGAVRNGYEYLGGDKTKQESWRKL